MENFHQLCSMWLIDGEHKNFPYILDWYYTSQNHDRDDNLRDVPSRHYDYDEENPKDFWIPSNLTQNQAKYVDNWENQFEDRMQSHLEASASAPLFRESVLQYQDSNNAGHHTRSHWWARTLPQGPGLQTSFLEPPNFYHEASLDCYENFSDRSRGEQEQQLDWRNSRGLSRTFYIDDLVSGEFNLPFDDLYIYIYRRPSESFPEDADPANLV